MHPKFKMPAVELVLTNLHAGGKFGQGAYKYSGGLHGVGAKCVNALSDWFKVEVSRDGKVYHMAFERGKTTEKLEVIGELKNKKHTGTLITFKPDPTIFTITTEFKFERLANRLRELAFLNPGLKSFSPMSASRRQKGNVLLQTRHRGIRQAARARTSKSFIRSRSSFRVNETKCSSMCVLQYNDSYNDQILPLRQLDPESGRRHAPDRFPHRADARRSTNTPKPTIC